MGSSSSSCSSFGVRSTGSEEDGDRIGRGKAQELSRDLIVEILVRLPVKTLLRFKSVSKLWYSLITSPNFIALHSTHSYRKKKVSLLFLRMVFRGPEVTVSFRFDQFVEDLTIPGDNVEIAGCFNGVVCLSLSYRPQRYALWNPATRQLREIEVPKEIETEVPRFWSNCNGFWSGNGFCFDSVANSFTVANITLTCAIGGGETRAHIIQFSTATNSWTQKSMGVPFRIWESGKRFTFMCPSISCVNRYMHCHIAVFHDMNGTVADDAYILSYDMIGGVFDRIEMPFLPIRCLIQLASCSGSLALFAETVYSRSVEDDAWVMNDCGGADQSWSKLVTCRRPSKVGPGVEVFIKSNDELVIVREPGNMVLLEQCYPYSQSLASFF